MNQKFVFVLFCFITITQCQQCNVQGEFEGIFTTSADAGSYNECLDICKDDLDCECFTYYQAWTS